MSAFREIRSNATLPHGSPLARYGATLLPLSFSGTYLGYISPDAYYDELYDNTSLAYETGIMSWAGPGQERFFTGLAYAAIDELGFR